METGKTVRTILYTSVVLLGALAVGAAYKYRKQKNKIRKIHNIRMGRIYLAGGCFWGVEAYFSKLPGVIKTMAGYANGNILMPTYKKVLEGSTGYAETVMVEYNPYEISLAKLLEHFFSIIDPTVLNRQGNDVGNQYRTGIYYVHEPDRNIIDRVIEGVATKYSLPIITEVEPLKNFHRAEEYHQKYLEKNPGGYCHIDITPVEKYVKYKRPSDDKLRIMLSDLQYKVTQQNATEAPFSSPYEENFEEGLYVDVVTGEPLFCSKDKYHSRTGWPSFTKPIYRAAVKERIDSSRGMFRTEVRSSVGDSHLGHVFEDGPEDRGGLRYCINGAALHFIPAGELNYSGYNQYCALFD